MVNAVALYVTKAEKTLINLASYIGRWETIIVTKKVVGQGKYCMKWMNQFQLKRSLTGENTFFLTEKASMVGCHDVCLKVHYAPLRGNNMCKVES